MNTVIEVGRFIRDPDIKIIRKEDGIGLTVARGIMIVNRINLRTKKYDTSDLFCITAFDKKAEFIGKYFKKGSKVIVRGELRNYNYRSKGGEMHYTNYILAKEIDFADEGKKEKENLSEEPFHHTELDPDLLMPLFDTLDWEGRLC